MEFNDNIVRPFDPKEIPNEAFGGEEKVTKILKREIAWNIGLFHTYFLLFFCSGKSRWIWWRTPTWWMLWDRKSETRIYCSTRESNLMKPTIAVFRGMSVIAKVALLN